MDIYLDEVTVENKDILYRLLHYSLFEMSENDLNEMNNEAIFEYKYFDRYFTEDSRDAFFIREKLLIGRGIAKYIDYFLSFMSVYCRRILEKLSNDN